MKRLFSPIEPKELAGCIKNGLPCIVPDLPSLRVVDDAKCGVMINLADESKAAQQITDYLYSDSSEHARNARAFAVENLTWEIIAQRYLTEFERLQQA